MTVPIFEGYSLDRPGDLVFQPGCDRAARSRADDARWPTEPRVGLVGLSTGGIRPSWWPMPPRPPTS